VQRNKTLEAAQKKLAEEHRQERERHKAELVKLKEEQARHEEDWRRTCFDLLNICRIQEKTVQLDLEHERGRVINEMRICREEKLERMKRDYKIKLFQMRDEELEQQMAQLVQDKVDLEEQWKEENARLSEQFEGLRTRLKETLSKLKQTKKSKDALQVRVIHSNLVVFSFLSRLGSTSSQKSSQLSMREAQH